jgi:membrane-bound lytic murein transglycosylase D
MSITHPSLKVFTLTTFLSLSACISTGDSSDEVTVPAPEVEPNTIDAVLDAERFNPKPDDVPEIGAEDDEINEVIKKGIPVEINDEVQKWIHFFTKKRPDLFARYMERGEKYKPMIVSTLRDQNVPTEIYYLAMIESGFVQHARSHASAVGLWQFIAATGRRYGLRVDYYADERIDPHRATIAATLYLNDLHNVFDSWYLAMAAYNAGEMRIMRAIMNGKTRNFWELARNKHLPAETMNYIPKFLAAVIIGSQPEKYGFQRPEPQQVEDVVSVKVPSGIRLKNIASELGVSYQKLKNHNRHLKRRMTPSGLKSYHLWVPKQYEAQFADASERLKKYVVKNSRKSGNGYHRVRRGENLISIANRYGMSLRELKQLNGLRSNRIYAGTRLRISGSPLKHYRVRRGDNLYLIASKFGMTLSQLKRMNRLRSNRIYPGTRLKVSAGSERSYYKVRRGDNLYAIAKKFGISVRELKRINRLRRNTIYAGQVLAVSNNRG